MEDDGPAAVGPASARRLSDASGVPLAAVAVDPVDREDTGSVVAEEVGAAGFPAPDVGDAVGDVGEVGVGVGVGVWGRVGVGDPVEVGEGSGGPVGFGGVWVGFGGVGGGVGVGLGPGGGDGSGGSGGSGQGRSTRTDTETFTHTGLGPPPAADPWAHTSPGRWIRTDTRAETWGGTRPFGPLVTPPAPPGTGGTAFDGTARTTALSTGPLGAAAATTPCEPSTAAIPSALNCLIPATFAR
ncbi:hypothetical protein GCM10010387_04930 [Streptomyces inusitatus]|uniref:Uncharacterized protein n=1 Tax=Streptomyces inusitatus TaxID=68221 RepID=A0A918UK36_9ACTN|nr:hypothetical protein GCM10010387_04930 [Streptomyces inusitatus]